MGNHIAVWLGLFLIVSSSASSVGKAETQSENAFCLDPKPRTEDTSTRRGNNFLIWNQLQLDQKTLLPDLTYTDWTIEADGKAATFLAVTHALELLQALPSTLDEFTGMDLIKEIHEVRTDRLIVTLNLDLLKKWQDQGGAYILPLVKNKVEDGNVKFYTHNTPAAGLHCGYDLQWYTDYRKTPHLHWNVRLSDGLADVHLDGIPPLLFGFIPNPLHLTYENSDVRYWLKKYSKKYGNPGFSVKRAIASKGS